MLTPSQSLLRIQDVMTKENISLTELAERTGVEKSLYKKFSAADKHLPVEVLSKISDLFGVSIAWLIGEATHPSREVSYQLRSTPRPLRYDEAEATRKGNGEISIEIENGDQLFNIDFLPETAGKLITELTALLVNNNAGKKDILDTGYVDTIHFSGPLNIISAKLNYSYEAKFKSVYHSIL